MMLPKIKPPDLMDIQIHEAMFKDNAPDPHIESTTLSPL